MSSHESTRAFCPRCRSSAAERSACKLLPLKCLKSFVLQPSCIGAASFECRVAQCNAVKHHLCETDRGCATTRSLSTSRLKLLGTNSHCKVNIPTAEPLPCASGFSTKAAGLQCIRMDVGTRMTHDRKQILRILHITAGPAPSRLGATLGRALVDPPPHHGAEP